MADITVSDFMKEKYNLIIYADIDLAKLNHFTSVISSNGTELMKPFKFTNHGDGFQMPNFRLSELSHLETASSPVLNPQHTTATFLSDILLPVTKTCVYVPTPHQVFDYV